MNTVKPNRQENTIRLPEFISGPTLYDVRKLEKLFNMDPDLRQEDEYTQTGEYTPIVALNSFQGPSRLSNKTDVC
ncbi:hypothetical protein BGP78_21995 [Pseudoalteromonas sp. MSK9-3]|nr:hypothetical protein BGP78_21995 [Pseudoalteromonas sp. MSK9-3]